MPQNPNRRPQLSQDFVHVPISSRTNKKQAGGRYFLRKNSIPVTQTDSEDSLHSIHSVNSWSQFREQEENGSY
jgi:hypothetical protein